MKKPPNTGVFRGFYWLRVEPYLCDFSNALNVRTLRAIAMPSDTKNMANLDWVWPVGKIR
jgi:hypothetical protein